MENLITEKKKPVRLLSVHLKHQKREDFLSYCKSVNKKPSTLINEMIDELLTMKPDFSEMEDLEHTSQEISETLNKPSAMAYQVLETPDLGQKSRIELRLAPTEKSKLEAAANKERCSTQTWILNAIRAVLTKQLQCGGRELELLGESNYQLLAIGRNLNQIAKHLNNPENKMAEKPTFDEIHAIRQLIIRHAKLVNKAIRASIERWSLA